MYHVCRLCVYVAQTLAAQRHIHGECTNNSLTDSGKQIHTDNWMTTTMSATQQASSGFACACGRHQRWFWVPAVKRRLNTIHNTNNKLVRRSRLRLTPLNYIRCCRTCLKCTMPARPCLCLLLAARKKIAPKNRANTKTRRAYWSFFARTWI